MAQIQITIPDNRLTRVVDGIAARYSYDERKRTNETKGQFAKRMMIEEFVIPAVKQAEIEADVIGRRQTISDDVDSNISIT